MGPQDGGAGRLLQLLGCGWRLAWGVQARGPVRCLARVFWLGVWPASLSKFSGWLCSGSLTRVRIYDPDSGTGAPAPTLLLLVPTFVHPTPEGETHEYSPLRVTPFPVSAVLENASYPGFSLGRGVPGAKAVPTSRTAAFLGTRQRRPGRGPGQTPAPAVLRGCLDATLAFAVADPLFPRKTGVDVKTQPIAAVTDESPSQAPETSPRRWLQGPRPPSLTCRSPEPLPALPPPWGAGSRQWGQLSAESQTAAG